jgi:hypothetical protein
MAGCIYLHGNIEESLKWFERIFKTNALERSFVDHDTLLGSQQDDKSFKDLKKNIFGMELGRVYGSPLRTYFNLLDDES